MAGAGIELVARGHHQQRGGDEVGGGAVDAVVEAIGRVGGRKGNGDEERGQET